MPQYALRLPDDLYERAFAMAREQGVSLNQFFLYAVSSMVADIEARSLFEKRRKPSRDEAQANLKSLLDRVPKSPPDPGDEVEPEKPVRSKTGGSIRGTDKVKPSRRGAATRK